jgi:hypothetical protein
MDKARISPDPLFLDSGRKSIVARGSTGMDKTRIHLDLCFHMCGLGPLDQLTARESRSILASVFGRVILSPLAALLLVTTPSESDSRSNDSFLV